MILAEVRAEIRELVKQNHGVEDENTTGYEDDLEALEAELRMRDATRKGKQATGGKKGVASEFTMQEDVQTLENETDAPGTKDAMESREMDEANAGEPMVADSAEAQLRLC